MSDDRELRDLLERPWAEVKRLTIELTAAREVVAAKGVLEALSECCHRRSSRSTSPRPAQKSPSSPES